MQPDVVVELLQEAGHKVPEQFLELEDEAAGLDIARSMLERLLRQHHVCETQQTLQPRVEARGMPGSERVTGRCEPRVGQQPVDRLEPAADPVGHARKTEQLVPSHPATARP